MHTDEANDSLIYSVLTMKLFRPFCVLWSFLTRAILKMQQLLL